MNVRFMCTSKRRVPKNAMLGPSTCASSMTSPVLISFTALSTDCGFMWLPDPRSSPAPHFDGHRSLSAGTVHDGAWACAATPPSSSADKPNVTAIVFMQILPVILGAHARRISFVATRVCARVAGRSRGATGDLRPELAISASRNGGCPDMSDTQFDQNAWLARIGYSGPVAPTLETLNRLIFAHSHSIAYETLDIMLGHPPKLDVPALQQKMLAGQRGGYCFEQNMLFRAGLRSLDYGLTGLQGRVVRGLAIDAPRPAIHMLLKVELPEGTYLADVGFGNLAPTCALLLAPQIEQETPHEVMRFIDVGGELTLQAQLRD